MKRLIAFLLIPFSAFGAATVTFNLADFVASTPQRKTMMVVPLSTPRGNSGNSTVIMSERKYYNTGTNGVVTITNMNEGLYQCSLYGLTSTSVFRVNVPDTNGTLVASDILITPSTVALETEEGTTLDLE